MGTGGRQAADQHISGLYTSMLMDSLAHWLSIDETDDVLKRAGDTRSVEELGNFSSWSSYEQFRRLLEEARIALDAARDAGRNCPISINLLNAEIAESVQALGSPGGVLASGDGANPLVPIRRYEMAEVGPNEWTISEWFVDGHAPYPEF